jgi:MarR family 2-MHQ and catechol resistance regulon transcriptional repressor
VIDAQSPYGGTNEAEPHERTWGDAEEEALRLWLALARSYHTMSRIVGGLLTDHGVTIPQFSVLEALYHLGPLSLGELADKLLVTGGNITYVMDRLEAEGFVERRRNPDDRRVVTAELTPAGTELVASTFPHYAEFVLARVEHLEPGERCELRRLLKKLGKGLLAEEDDEDHAARRRN